MLKPVTYNVVLLRPELPLLWFTLPMLALGLLLASTGWSPMLGMVFISGGATLSLRFGRSKPAKVRRVAGKLTIAAAHLALGGAVIATRRSLRAGILVPTSADLVVRLTRAFPFRPIDIEVRDDEDGRGVLRALGFDTLQRVARFRLGSMAAIRQISLNGALIFWAVVMMFIAARALSDQAPGEMSEPELLVVFVLATWIGVYFKSTTFVVGADGIHVRWLWKTHYLPHAEIRAIGVDGFKLARKGLILELSRGRVLRFPVRAVLGAGYAEDEAICVVARVREALDLFRARQPAEDARLPDRGERPVAEWIRALRAAGKEGAVDHRTAPITAEALLQIAEDPGADRLARSRAAVALGASLGSAGRLRLRVAAEATAAPELRAVLEASAEEADEERLSRALSRLTRE